MTQTDPKLSSDRSSMDRKQFLKILDAAVTKRSFHFAHQAADSWLKTYPGDLMISLALAHIQVYEGNTLDAMKLLDKLIEADPQFLEAYQLQAELYEGSSSEKLTDAVGCSYVLGGAAGSSEASLPEWSIVLREGSKSIQAGQFGPAQQLIHQAIGLNPELVLSAVLHLILTNSHPDVATTFQLAKLYHGRWPTCLQFSLFLADGKLQMGDETGAVSLLHQCAANDATGQVPNRLWGENHRYSPLWPENLSIHFDLPIPSEVAAYLGLNQLAAGPAQTGSVSPVTSAAPRPIDISGMLKPGLNGEKPASSQPAAVSQPVVTKPAEVSSGTVIETPSAPTPAAVDADQADGSPLSTGNLTDNVPDTTQTAEANPKRLSAYEASLRPIEETFDKLTKKLKKNAIGRLDGRFPMYVILSTKIGLTNQYGLSSATVIDSELNNLAETVRTRPGWGALVLYPDDPECTTRLGLKAVDAIDPWKIKLALVDLDNALAKKGEMIGALLIVGGPDIVPFHRLPNPTDDIDKEVCSDNPYCTLDNNYFVPEWPVGRLPGEIGPDAGLLLDQIRNVSRYHNHKNLSMFKSKPFKWPMIIWKRVNDLLKTHKKTRRIQSIGYTAAIWRQSSQAVFRHVGDTHSMLISPPESSGSFKPERLTTTKLGYYNLHGVEDGPDWYGQRDSTETCIGPEYPVALSPKDLIKNGHAPQLVFSEACYGANIQNKSVDKSLALRFMSIGTPCVVGSTCVCYGSVSSPLIGGDLLGSLFWRYYKEGLAVGEALMQAKIEFVREMNRRQGYLDGEDQKTLLSFILYGDPLLIKENFPFKSKSAYRFRSHPMVKMVCDRQNGGGIPDSVADEVIDEVKQIVKTYLPGMKDGEIHLSQQHNECNGRYHHCPTSDLGNKSAEIEAAPNRYVVTISKETYLAQHIHHTYARVTLDAQHKMIKMVVSR
ncbi:MAG: hypothetical protein P4L50_25675 [Anaerolineaceae bacterium]|nr:hypothetical protein [Anaerolineaceae bacterium]